MKLRSGVARGRVSLMAASAALAILLTGCGGTSTSSTDTAQIDRDATLKVMYGMSASLDPVDAPEPAQLTFATWPVYDKLIDINAEAAYEPMLATDWVFTDGGKVLTLTLRDDVTFSDGETFDAEAVKANLERYLAADGSAVQANLASLDRVEVKGANEVALHLKQPTTEILSALSSNLGGIMISPKALDSDDLASKPVGTGAYVIESFRPSQQAVYVRRADEGGIWDQNTGNVAKVEISAISGNDAKLNALKSGQIDLTTMSGNASAIQAEVDSGQLQLDVLDGTPNMVGMYFNPARTKQLADPKVRQAINLAIDREGLVEAIQPLTEPRVQPWPQGLAGFDESREETYPHDPGKAKRLLAEAGYPDGFDAGEFLCSTSADICKAGEIVQGNLAEIGIEIELRTMDILSQVTAYAKGDAAGQFMYMSLPSIDPYSWLQRLFVNPVWTPAGPSPEMAELIKGINDPSLSESDRAERVGAAVDHATDNALYAPLWQGVGGLAASSKVQGLAELHGAQGGVANLRYLAKTK